MPAREIAKTGARLAANVAALPFLLIHALKVPAIGKDRALEGSTQCLSLIPGLCGQYVRRAFLAWTIAECHPSASIGFGTIFSKAATRIGENVYIGPYCSLGSVAIERDALVATGVHLLSGARMHGTADRTRPIREQPGEFVHITLGAGCWIGAGAVVMADVGRDSIVGAGAVVTKAIPESVIAVGVPAKVIGSRPVAAIPSPTE
jgi:acetyltransferase-like isoleucine patch superfamily enzyme